MIPTNDSALYEKIKSLHLHGQDGTNHAYRHKYIGINSRLDEIQAAVLNVKLKRLEHWNEKRRRLAERYNRLINNINMSSPNVRQTARRIRPALWRIFIGTTTGLPAMEQSLWDGNPGIIDSRLRGNDKSTRIASVLAASRPVPRNDEIILPTETPGAYHVYHQYAIRVPNRDALLSYFRENGIVAGVYYPVPIHLQPCFDYLGYKEGDFPEAERASREVLTLPLYPQLIESQQRLVIRHLVNFT